LEREKHMKHIPFIFLLPLILLSACGSTVSSPPHHLTGGDWISSGGETLKDAHNPWWLKNTKAVDYCIDLDSTSISAPAAKVERAVSDSLAFWQAEFSRTVSFFEDPHQQLPKWNHAGVGKQAFRRVPCTGTEDLRFQFGHGTLTESQISFLKNPLRFVAVAVRTHYDESLLRGKGFIFVGSDIGPKRFAPQTQIERVWSYETALQLAVLHELGHVFGIPHLGNRYSLMGAGILELFTHKVMEPILGHITEAHNESTFFMPAPKRRGCTSDEKQKDLWQNYFELEGKPDCLTFQFEESARQFTVHGHDEKGTVKWGGGGIGELALKVASWPTSGVVIFLNPLQTVFPGMDPKLPLGLQMGPYFVAGQGGGRLVSKKGTVKPLHLQIGPEEFNVAGEFDGKHQSIVYWSVKPY